MRRRTRRYMFGLLGVTAAALLWGQESQQEAKPAEAPKTVQEESASPAVAAPVDPKSFKLGPEDVLLVRVWREPELSGLVAIRPDGKINLPLVGEMTAAGLTPEQLTAAVTESLTKFINRPQVLVSVQAVRSRKYLISGEVNRPGVYPLVTPITVMEAIVQAGGLREFASKGKITILRGDKRLKFNYGDVVKGKNLSQNIPIEHGDHVVVP